MYKIRLKIVHIQIVGNPMGTNCARRVVADLPLFCYERDFMLSLFDNNFEQMENQIYPTELQ